ncbi:hypothetical protein MUK42_10827 [Musa troglodytarum]|uniref:At3g05675-like ankyrin-like domain-containing protein n=1 Tax=Musa troglodytarum TaxID=320322 RepID=A0A9E7FHZ8_9LILI|nr:hypothetical protein MUK42_10827 [Musa troglodytarum]
MPITITRTKSDSQRSCTSHVYCWWPPTLAMIIAHVYRNEHGFDKSSPLRFGLDPGCFRPLSVHSCRRRIPQRTLQWRRRRTPNPDSISFLLLVAPRNNGGCVWCCSFAAVLQGPNRRCRSSYHRDLRTPKPSAKPSHQWYFHSSPSPSNKLGLGIIDPRRLISPGRVSPIDPDAPLDPLPEIPDSASIPTATAESEPGCPHPAPKERSSVPYRPETDTRVCVRGRSLDLRLCLKGKDGRCLVLELDSRVLCESSAFFTAMVVDSSRKVSDAYCQWLEVAGLEDVDVFKEDKETVELMYDKDAARWPMRAGVSRAIAILEEALNSIPMDQMTARKGTKPLIERVSKQVADLNGLLEILIDKEFAEDFVGLWANQEELIRMHERASPMRCSKGLDMGALEESLSEVILTLTLKQQHMLFEE